jgi:hypothetical protein
VVWVSGVTSNGTYFTVQILASITLTPTNPSILVNATQQMMAVGQYTDNTLKYLTTTATWSSSSTTIATINSAGLVSGVASGQTTIQVTVGNVSQSVTLSVGVPSFVVTGSLNMPRHNHTATVLTNGKVLIVGGTEYTVGDTATAELYDPATGTFSTTGTLSATRTQHTATLLNDGRVMIVGGFGSNSATAELYDPISGTFSNGPSLPSSRFGYTATLLNNGMVLIAGGIDGNHNLVTKAQLYDPTAGSLWKCFFEC